MKLDALKRAVDIVKGRKIPPSITRVRKAIEEKEAEKLTLIEVAVERGKRLAKAEKQAEAVVYLAEERKALKKRYSKAGKKTQRDTKDSGLWERYEAFRSMKRHLALARKEHRRLTQLQAAQRVIDASNGKITVDAETLVRYFRAWLKKRKTD